jgi:hypothetical protein
LANQGRQRRQHSQGKGAVAGDLLMAAQGHGIAGAVAGPQPPEGETGSHRLPGTLPAARCYQRS